MPTFQGVEFPPLGWLPDPDQLNSIGEAILAVAYGGLEQHSVPDAQGRPMPFAMYDRRFVGHGAEAPVDRSKACQLTVVCGRVFPGRAGEEEFQFVKGASGKLGFQTAQFQVEISRPYPVTQGGAIHVDKITETRELVWKDGLIVWASLLALCLGGVRVPAIPRCDDVLLSSLTARNPAGGEASWVINVLVQL